MSTVLTQITGSSSVERVHIVSGLEESTNSSFVQVVLIREPAEEPTALEAAEHPVLAAIWDNESDAAYDEL
ncbi:MAG: hypothetical protein IH609_04315 [Dehalococcoidia bacterium]|nr:hypothetical protein [Dehalococcoidia bacterium]